MEKASANVLLSDFKNLVLLLKNFGPSTCLRVRLQGEMWINDFMHLGGLIKESKDDFSGIILNDETADKAVVINDVSRIIQFEIDKPLRGYRPFFHYTVVLFDIHVPR